MFTIVISGHGQFSQGFKSFLDLVYGPTELVSYIDFTQEDSPETLKDKYLQYMEKNNGSVLFCCDIQGGTPFQTLIKLFHENPQVHVIAGANIPLVFSALDRADETLTKDTVHQLIAEAKTGIMTYQTPTRENTIAEEGGI